MVPKKSNYWDQIFANQAPEADDASPNEENAPDLTETSDTQEHDKNVREILFEEENPDAAPAAALQKEFELETPSGSTVLENEDCTVNDSQDDDPFSGWTQTTKTYSSLNFNEEEPQDAEEYSDFQNESEDAEENQPVEILTNEIAEDEAKEETETEEEESEETTESDEETDAEEAPSEPILSEDGSLRITLNRYEHPAKGFGFGLLEEAEEAETEEVEEETAEETVQAEAPDEEVEVAEEPETQVAPPGLDSWGSLAFELGLPVTIPETAAPKASAKSKKEEKSPKSVKEEKGSKSRGSEDNIPKLESKIVIDLDDEDLISPENVFADSGKEARSSRGDAPEHGRRKDKESVSDFGFKQVSIPEMDELTEVIPPRRRRKGNAGQESSANEKKAEAIGAIVAGVVASKAKDEVDKSGRKSSKNRSSRPEIQEEEAPVSRRERSRRSRRPQVEEVPLDDFVTDEDLTPQVVQEDDEEETAVPNGARSRRRRRSQHEKMEQAKTRAAAQAEEDDDDESETEEVSFQPKKRSRRDGRNRFREELEDEKSEWLDAEEETGDEEDEEEEIPRSRRQRRSGRSGSRNRFQEDRADEDFEDEEDHVFTEVKDDDEDEEDDEWETDFSQHDVPGWRYTIDFIVNSNLKARKREPSSMVENIARMNKRGGKRK